MPGVEKLPTPVQVALLSLIFNRGSKMSKGKGTEADIMDSRWEKRELAAAVMLRDLVWIYWHFESMRRIWASKPNEVSVGLLNRRDAELALIYPFVESDLKHEALLERNPRWR